MTFTASPLPSDFEGNPQALFDAIVERLALETQESLALFGTGSVLPVSDQGPFLLDGTTWYVWSDDSGSYVPQTILFEASLDPKPWRGNLTAPQEIEFGGPGSDSADLILSEEYDPGSVFDDSTFIAPVDGYYNVKAKVGFSATAGTPTDIIVLFYLKKNGFQLSRETVFEELGNVYTGRTYLINTDLQLAAGDTIKATLQVSIGGGTATWTIAQNDTWMSGSKIKSA